MFRIGMSKISRATEVAKPEDMSGQQLIRKERAENAARKKEHDQHKKDSSEPQEVPTEP